MLPNSEAQKLEAFMTWQILKNKCLEAKKSEWKKMYPSATDNAITEVAGGGKGKVSFGVKFKDGETVYSEAYRELLLNKGLA